MIYYLDIYKISILYLNKLENKHLKLYKYLKQNNQQIFKFFVSGVIAASFNFISYRSLYLLLGNILFASLSGYCVGIIVSFIFAKFWVFKKSASQSLLKSFSLFCGIYCVGGIEMSLVILFFNQFTGNYEIAWLFGAFIATLNNYLGSKYISFKK